jgi:hypothetical protein
MATKRKSKRSVRPIDESNISGGEPLVSGRGGMGPDRVELPGDQGSRAKRGRAEEEEQLVVKEDDRPRRGKRRPYVSKGEKTNEQIKHQQKAKK